MIAWYLEQVHISGFHTGICCGGGGNFVSGEQWAWEACLPGGGGGGGLGVPQNIFEKVSALRVRDLATKH